MLRRAEAARADVIDVARLLDDSRGLCARGDAKSLQRNWAATCKLQCIESPDDSGFGAALGAALGRVWGECYEIEQPTVIARAPDVEWRQTGAARLVAALSIDAI